MTATATMQEFPTGAHRSKATGKGRYDLASPWAEARVARVREAGADLYGDRNWEKGMPLSRFVDAAKRHIEQHLMGDRSEDHLAQARWNLDAAMHIETGVGVKFYPQALCDCGPWAHITNPLDMEVPPACARTDLFPEQTMQEFVLQAGRPATDRWELTEKFHALADEIAQEDFRQMKLPFALEEGNDEPRAATVQPAVPRVYIAAPYTSDPAENTARAAVLTHQLIQAGYQVFCPHTMTRPFCKLDDPGNPIGLDLEPIMQNDFSFIENWATVVLRVPGYSVGATRECDFAERIGVPVVYGVQNLPPVTLEQP